MKLRGYFILALFYFVSVMYSCSKEEEGGFNTEYFKVYDIVLENQQFVGPNLDERDTISPGDSINWDELIIRLDYLSTTYYAARQKHFSGNLFALSPVPICCDPVGLDTIFIIAMNDYNVNYNSGDTMNEAMSISRNLAQNKSELLPESVEEYIMRNKESLYVIERADILLNEPPSDSFSNQHFKIIVKMNDDRVFETISPELGLFQ